MAPHDLPDVTYCDLRDPGLVPRTNLAGPGEVGVGGCDEIPMTDGATFGASGELSVEPFAFRPVERDGELT